MSRRSVRAGCSVLLVVVLGCAEMQGFDLGSLLALGPPDEPTVARGLKEALQVGTEATSSRLSTPGGFADDRKRRIRLPGALGELAQALRGAGLGSHVDDFETRMNRAAEQATAKAAPIFAQAIASMTIEDAFSILNGEEDSATRYFRERTSGALRRAFTPVVASSMDEVGLVRAYRDIVARYDAIPFSRLPKLDLEGYVVDRTMSALFAEIALEEARIREDPAARTTALLRRVFGYQAEAKASPPPS